jgi:hypothetical protein
MTHASVDFPKVYEKFHSHTVKKYILIVQEPLYSRKMCELPLETMFKVIDEFVFFMQVVQLFMKVLV